jgi:hypothetical protein
MKMSLKKSNANLFLIMVGFSLFLMTGCQKYDEGPAISFRTRTERVSNTWKVDNYKVNGTDVTSLVSSYNETFTKGGGYSYEWGEISGAGTWKFQNKDEEIALTGTDNQNDHVLYILKLEEKQFWYYYISDGDRHEFHLVEK